MIVAQVLQSHISIAKGFNIGLLTKPTNSVHSVKQLNRIIGWLCAKITSFQATFWKNAGMNMMNDDSNSLDQSCTVTY